MFIALKISVATIAACVLSGAIHAQNIVINGNFEEGEGTAFWQTQPWYNIGTGLNQGASARSQAVGDESLSATVNDRYSSAAQSGPIAYVQKTNHIIQPGDTYALFYSWRPVDEFWQINRDRIRFVFFTTSNGKMGGEKVWVSEIDSPSFQSGSAMQKVEQVSEPATKAAEGKPLFVMFYGIDTSDSEAGPTHWAKVDNIELHVHPGS